ncbi:unnamed protein product [Prorocentrum cordatum]|uniref:Uncharacterized protein n=1 Tax=Prorocentrum cordatum TaxID=2364126 RepID=A0ABN9W5I9_9DINO|nr:unnamed protein product [Polarella glacialis]
MGNGLEYSHASSFAALPTAFRYSFHQADAADAVAARFSHQVDAADPFAAIVWQARGWDFHTRWLRPILFASIVWQAAARGGPSCLRPRWGGQGRAAASGGQSHLARRRGARVWPAGCRRDAMSSRSRWLVDGSRVELDIIYHHHHHHHHHQETLFLIPIECRSHFALVTMTSGLPSALAKLGCRLGA